MFQVQVSSSGGGPTYDFGPPVDSLEKASFIVEMGDWLYDALEFSHGQTYEHLPETFALRYWEGCDIYAKQIGGDDLYEAILDHDNKTVWQKV